MKYDSKTKTALVASSLLCLLGFSSEIQAVRLSDACSMGHGMTHTEGGARKAVETLVEAECSGCHGMDGNGIRASDDVPYIAGQDAMYLCAWLDVCRKKGNKCESHEDIAAQLTDQDIVNLAEFYAHSQPKW